MDSVKDYISNYNKEYYDKNRNKILEQKKQYLIDHPLPKNIQCECFCSIKPSEMKKHLLSDKHIRNMEKLKVYK